MTPNVTLLFFVLLVPLAGFIAWAGDRIGHKSGKRRQSLFGLRPRHTAMVFTIGSGMLTALASFGLFWLFSETFRIVVRDGATMYDTNRRLKVENNLQSAALNRIRKQTGEAEKALDAMETERDRANTALATATQKRADAEADAQKAQVNLGMAQAGLKVAQQNLAVAEKSLTDVKGNLSRKTQQVVDAERQVQLSKQQVVDAARNTTFARLQQAKADRDKRTAQNDALIAQNDAKQVRKSISDFRGMNKTLYGQNNTLFAQNKDLYDQATQLKAQLGDRRKEYADLDKQVADLNLARQKAEEEVRLLRTDASALRSGQITYQVGQEVDRLSIRPGFSVWRVEAVLTAFLNSASKKAQSVGAKGKGSERAVAIPDRPLTDADKNRDRDAKFYTEDDAIRDTAALIRRSNEDMVVLVTTTANAVAGETVPVRFQVFRNPVVLRADTKLGELNVNGDGPRQEVADRVGNFLSRDIHRELIKSGIIPPLRGEDANGGDLTRITDPFTLNGDEWLTLMDKVRNAGPRARVVVYTARDLRAADAPSLRFDVKRPLINPPAFLRDIR